MADNSDVWTGNGRDDEPRERSPRRDTRDERERSPARRERTRSPARNGGGGGSNAHNGPPNPEEQNQGDNLHVSGLSRNMTEKQLTELFNQYAKVYKAEIMYDPHTRESRGFGFVKMDTAEDARIAIEKFNGTVHDGKSMTVAHARRGRARTPTPGRYHGVKLDIGGPRGGYGGSHYGGDRPYQPRSYDSRYDRGPPPRSYDDRRYDDRERRYDDRRYDDRPQRYDDRRYDDRGAPPADRPRYDDRPPRDDRPRYDERPPRY